MLRRLCLKESSLTAAALHQALSRSLSSCRQFSIGAGDGGAPKGLFDRSDFQTVEEHSHEPAPHKETETAMAKHLKAKILVGNFCTQFGE